MTDAEWLELVKKGEDEGWKLVWERVVEPESRSQRSSGIMHRNSLDAGDLMGMLYEEMIGGGKINLFRGEGSLAGWLRRYVRGYILNSNPNTHGEVFIDGALTDGEGNCSAMELPVEDKQLISKEVWINTHYCFHDLWMKDPERAYIHLLKTRFHFSSEETKNFLDISSTANVDQIFSRNVKFMRESWKKHENRDHRKNI